MTGKFNPMPSSIFTETEILPLMELTFALENITNAASTFLEYTSGYKVFIFSGSMGAGKYSMKIFDSNLSGDTYKNL